MKFLRNPEVSRTVLIYVLVSGAAVGTAFGWEEKFGWFTLGFAALLLLLYLIGAFLRYRQIARLSADIDRILHGNDPQISLQQYAEGELCILQNEIYKMTVRLREQKQRLQDDKTYLADSIADISHQIRTPLTSINLLVQLLREPNLTEARKMQLTRELLELLTRIDWLITTLLKISKLDAGTVQFQKQVLPLEELLQKAVEPLLVPVELRGQTLEIQAAGNFTGDVAWTCEAVGNIVKNCMEHTPEGGRILVSAMENPLYTEIKIADTGNGICQEDLPHIFERFYKGQDSEDKSFGIGLALARMIVTRQNGTIKAENGAEQGALFTLRFYKGVV